MTGDHEADKLRLAFTHIPLETLYQDIVRLAMAQPSLTGATPYLDRKGRLRLDFADWLAWKIGERVYRNPDPVWLLIGYRRLAEQHDGTLWAQREEWLSELDKCDFHKLNRAAERLREYSCSNHLSRETCETKIWQYARDPSNIATPEGRFTVANHLTRWYRTPRNYLPERHRELFINAGFYPPANRGDDPWDQQLP